MAEDPVVMRSQENSDDEDDDEYDDALIDPYGKNLERTFIFKIK